MICLKLNNLNINFQTFKTFTHFVNKTNEYYIFKDTKIIFNYILEYSLPYLTK